MTFNNQTEIVQTNQITMKRGFPVYRRNPSVPTTDGLPTRTRRIRVPGGKGAMIVDNSTGEIKGLGGVGFWWEEEVDSSRFVKLFLDGIKQAAGLSKAGMQVFELVYRELRRNPGSDEIKLNLLFHGSKWWWRRQSVGVHLGVESPVKLMNYLEDMFKAMSSDARGVFQGTLPDYWAAVSRSYNGSSGPVATKVSLPERPSATRVSR